MNAADRLLGAMDRVARRFTLWKLNRDFRGWKPTASIEPAAEAERWISTDGTAVVLEQDLDRQQNTITLGLEGFHRLMADAGYVRTDNLSPEDAA